MLVIEILLLILLILCAVKYYLKSRRVARMLSKFNGLSMFQFAKHIIKFCIPPMGMYEILYVRTCKLWNIQGNPQTLQP